MTSFVHCAKRSWVLPVLSVVFLSTTTANGQSKFVKVDRPAEAKEPPVAFVADEFIAVLTRQARTNVVVGRNAKGRPTVNLPSLQQVLNAQSTNRFRRQFTTAKAYPVDSKFPDLTGHYKIKLDAGIDLDIAMVAFARNPHVEHVEKIGIHALHAIPNDPFFFNEPPIPEFPYNQWALFQNPCGIGGTDAWDRHAGDGAVVVAVLDSGVRYIHADLGGSDPPGPDDPVTNGNIWVNVNEIPGNGLDDDGNGFIDDVIGYDFVEDTAGAPYPCCDDDCGGRDNDPRDHNGHGTHVAGTVAAITNNGTDVAGVAGGFSAGNPGDTANGVKIMPLRIGWSASDFLFGCLYGLVRTDYAAEAMQYVAGQVDDGVNVAAVNCSWGSSDSGGLGAAVDALLARDVMIIHSAGNSADTIADFLRFARPESAIRNWFSLKSCLDEVMQVCCADPAWER